MIELFLLWSFIPKKFKKDSVDGKMKFLIRLFVGTLEVRNVIFNCDIFQMCEVLVD